MTLVSRDEVPPRTPYEAELRERLERAESRATMYEKLATAQDQVVRAATAIRKALPAPAAALAGRVAALVESLTSLEMAQGRILLESMPPELMAGLAAPSTFEGVPNAPTEPAPSTSGMEAFHVPAGPNTDALPMGPLWPGLQASLDVAGLARDLELAGPLEVEQLAGHGWPAGWADYTGISDQEIVWPVQPKGQPVPGGTPIAAFVSHAEQALYWRLRNAAPTLLAIARAAEALRDVSVAHYRWCRKAHSGDSNECTCDASRANEKLDALRRALGLDGV